MHGYIYETTNVANNKKYIGQSKKDLPNNYLGSGKIILWAIKKYGEENFTCKIIETCNSQDKLNEREIHWIKETRDHYGKENCYNITSGGNYRDGFTHKLSDEHKEKIRQSKLGIPLTEQHKKNVSVATSKAQLGKPHHKQWIENQAKATRKKIKSINLTTKEEIIFQSYKSCWEYYSKLLSLTTYTVRGRAEHNKLDGYEFELIQK